MNIRQLVAANRLEQAINLIGGNESILLMGRLNRLNKEVRMGTISNSNSNIERNRIVSAILSYSKEEDVNVTVFNSIKDSLSEKVGQFLRSNKRTKFRGEIEALLSDVEDYESEKKRSSTYDRRGKILCDLEDEFETLKGKIQEKSEQSTDKVLEQIEELLDDGSKAAVSTAILKLKLIFTDSDTIRSLESRLDDVGDMRKHRNKIIADIDVILENISR